MITQNDIVMPGRADVYSFIKRNYIASRFKNSPMIKDHPNYADLIIDGYMDDLRNDNVAYIGPYESVRGTFIQFDRSLQPINESEPIEKMRHSW